MVDIVQHSEVVISSDALQLRTCALSNIQMFVVVLLPLFNHLVSVRRNTPISSIFVHFGSRYVGLRIALSFRYNFPASQVWYSSLIFSYSPSSLLCLFFLLEQTNLFLPLLSIKLHVLFFQNNSTSLVEPFVPQYPFNNVQCFCLQC